MVVGRVPSMIHFTPPICGGNTRKAEYSPLSAQGQLKALAAPQCEDARLYKDLTRKKCDVREKLGSSWLRSACIAPAAAGSLSNGVDHPDEAGCRTLYVKSMDCSFTALPSSIYQEHTRFRTVLDLDGAPMRMQCCLTSDSIPLICVYDNSLSRYWNAASPESSAPRQGHTTLFGKRSYQRDLYSEHKGRVSYVSVLSSKSLLFWSVFNILSTAVGNCSPGIFRE